MSKTNKIKYFAYVRKSTEGEERQALSISSQMDKVKEFFGSLEIVEVLEEKHSAFKPYNRPVFADMIKRIQNCEASGIIAWHPDRLSRNEIDASTITYLVRTGIIADLKFGSYNFDNSPEGIMMLQLSLSQSQYFSSKLGKDVRRGLEKKFEMGWHPNKCPNGYINITRKNHGYSTIKTDEKRFKILRKAFDLMITGNYSVPEILNKLNNEWGFKPKEGKNPLSRSALYRMFTNLFYAGIIEYNGKQKQGKHKAMISLEEYDRIQFLLGRDGKPRNRKNDFAYTGLIRCANCGCMVSADRKVKTIKATGEQKEYIYYCCTHKKREEKCKEKSIEVKSLEKQIEQELSKYEFEKDFRKFLFKVIDEENEDKPKESEIIANNLKDKINTLKIEKTNLTKLICKGLISDEEFQKQRNEYEKEISIIKQKLSRLENGREDERIKKVKFVIQSKINFKKGNQKDRREVLNEIGSNREIKDKKLTITPYKWLIPVQKDIKGIEAEFYRLELDKNPLKPKQKEAYTSLCRNLLGGMDSNHDKRLQRPLSYRWTTPECIKSRIFGTIVIIKDLMIFVKSCRVVMDYILSYYIIIK
jgi:site-specific DNA recombinase